MSDSLRSLPLPQLIKAPMRRVLVRHFERRFERGRLNAVFIVGHIRSGSTLLLHILNTNPGIDGYGETHREYRRVRDLAYLTFDVCRSFHRFRPRGPYVLDKVLYRDYIQNPDLLREEFVKLVFLVRAPEQCIPSIVRFKPRDIHGEDEILRYYLRQLKMVEEYARTANDTGRAFFLTYDQLLNEAPRVLVDLGRFLGLATPLSERYETTWATGQRGPRGLGDDSEEITTGRIVRDRQRDPVPLKPETIRQAREAYDRCLAVLPTLCAHAGNGKG